MVQRTHRGLRRPQNEDRLGTWPELGLAVLADGMGGHRAGEVASAMAVAAVLVHFRRAAAPDSCPDSPPPTKTPHAPLSDLLRESLEHANRQIHAASQANQTMRGMGTTAVAMRFTGTALEIAHVGDSRVYRWRTNRLEPLTEDHSVAQEWVRKGRCPGAEPPPQARHQLTRALGIDSHVRVDVGCHQVAAGDLYLACSDGLTDMLTDADIAAQLATATTDLEHTADTLIAQANENGGLDNISVILARAAVAPSDT
ncbi:MAG: serine/threonine-protein phosphatase [Cellvibrionales bacterium]|nr:serine/threonine-protein phosphatase [Cellvibrionales bacterium]